MSGLILVRSNRSQGISLSVQRPTAWPPFLQAFSQVHSSTNIDPLRMVSTAPIAIRRADLADLDAVQRISEEAYIPAYMAALGVIPKPAFENYRPRIERGEVWLLEADGEPAGLIVLEEKPAHVVIYSIAVRPAQQGRGHARSLLQFAAQQAV